MAHEEIIQRLKDMMKRSSQIPIDWNSVTSETAIQSLGFDSLSILDLIYDIQQEFGLEFEAEEVISVKTVGQLAAFLHERQKTKA